MFDPIVGSKTHFMGPLVNGDLGTSLSYDDGSGAEFWTPVKSQTLRRAALTLGHHMCRGCGFKSRKYQEVLAPNGQVWALDQMQVVCIFCAGVKCIDLVAPQRSGVALYLPEWSQKKLVVVAKAIYVARISQGPIADQARELLDLFMHRRRRAEKIVGGEATANALLQHQRAMGPDDVEAGGLRVWPLDRRIIKEADLEFNQFPQILAYWRSKDGPFGSIAPPTWDPDAFMPYLTKMRAASPLYQS
ncbi:MAG: type IV secretion protein DotN [Pseudomonadota bacterium]